MKVVGQVVCPVSDYASLDLVSKPFTLLGPSQAAYQYLPLLAPMHFHHDWT